MADAYVEVDVRSSRRPSGMSKAIKALRAFDSDFPSILPGWWHKPPDNMRSVVARFLSRHGLSGRLSVELHDGVSAWDMPPKSRWTGFTTRRER